MIFAPSDATVIEFLLKPLIDRAYGYMAMALGLDYWAVPEVSSPYLGTYNMSLEAVDAVIKLVRHIIREKKYSFYRHTLPGCVYCCRGVSIII
jgi:hypothetical protein